MPACDNEFVLDQVQKYYDKGIRVIFPVHKYDNGFSGGDGSDGAIEIGNVMNSGHYGNQISDCPDMEHNFDSGAITFGGLNRPREEYVSAPPLDMTDLDEDPLRTLLPLVNELTSGAIEGDYCQAQGPDRARNNPDQ